MGFAETMDYYWNGLADPRTNDWFLVGSPIPILIIMFNYLYFVLKCGPKFMENRKPYELKTFIKYYNIFQVVSNALIIYCLIKAGWFTTISLGCEPVDYSPNGLFLAKICYWIYMIKLIDLVETGVFVLRKKNRQISFLHLYHHVSTAALTWISVKFIAGGMATFSILVNSAVHVIMYSYYYASSLNSPTVNAIINPIKRYITIIQMVQFIILLLHTIQTFLPSCPVPRSPGFLFTFNLLANFFLFYNFYQKNYKQKSKKTR